MTRLTKPQARLHGEAESLLSLERKLKMKEREFVYRHWREDAVHANAKNAAFFTPIGVARLVAIEVGDRHRVVDAGAGIGVLSWAILERQLWSSDAVDLTCIEFNPEFVEIGKRLLPEAEWICADIFDVFLWESLGEFGVFVSNPPFGRAFKLQADTSWLNYCGSMHLMAAEVSIRVARLGGVMLMPTNDMPLYWDKASRPKFRQPSTGRRRDLPLHSRALESFLKKNPGFNFNLSSFDISISEDNKEDYTWHSKVPDIQIYTTESDVEIILEGGRSSVALNKIADQELEQKSLL